MTNKLRTLMLCTAALVAPLVFPLVASAQEAAAAAPPLRRSCAGHQRGRHGLHADLARRW